MHLPLVREIPGWRVAGLGKCNEVWLGRQASSIMHKLTAWNGCVCPLLVPAWCIGNANHCIMQGVLECSSVTVLYCAV